MFRRKISNLLQAMDPLTKTIAPFELPLYNPPVFHAATGETALGTFKQAEEFTI